MSKTNQRLQLIVDQLPDKQSIIADIGTDHGYLPIMAVKQNKASYAFAADLNEKPLKSATNNVKKNKLEEKIDVLQIDGLTFFENNNIKLDYVVISGLGSTTITDIMKNDYDNIENYLICSNTEPSKIRKYAKNLKLGMKKEMFFYDNGRKYWLIELSRNEGTIFKSFKDVYLGKDISLLSNKLYQEYLEKEFNKNKSIFKKMKFNKKKIKLLYLNRLIKKELKNGTYKNS